MSAVSGGSMKPSDRKLQVIELGISHHDRLASSVPTLMRCSGHCLRNVYVGNEMWLASTSRYSQPYLYACPSSGTSQSSTCVAGSASFQHSEEKAYRWKLRLPASPCVCIDENEELSTSENIITQHYYLNNDLFKESRIVVSSNDERFSHEMALRLYKVDSNFIKQDKGHRHCWSILAVTKKLMRCLVKNSVVFFRLGRHIFSLLPEYPLEKISPFNSNVEAVKGTSGKAPTAILGQNKDIFNHLLNNRAKKVSQLEWQLAHRPHPPWTTTLYMYLTADEDVLYFFPISVKTPIGTLKYCRLPRRWKTRGFTSTQPSEEKAYKRKRRLPALPSVFVAENKDCTTSIDVFSQILYRNGKRRKERHKVIDDQSFYGETRLMLCKDDDSKFKKMDTDQRHCWSIMAAAGELVRRLANNSRFFFHPVRQLFPQIPKYLMEKPPLCGNKVYGVTETSCNVEDSGMINSSLALRYQANPWSFRNDGVFFTDPCSSFQGLKFFSLLGSYLPSSHTSIFVYAATWHSQDRDEAQSDGDVFDHWQQQQQNRPTDRQTAGVRSESLSGLRAPTECTDGSVDSGDGGGGGECCSLQRSVVPEAAESPRRRTPAEDLRGIYNDGDSYADCHVAPSDRCSHDRLPPEHCGMPERSENAAWEPSDGSSSQLLGRTRCCRRDGSEELSTSSGQILDDRRAATNFSVGSDRWQPHEPKLGCRLAGESSGGELEPRCTLLEGTGDGSNKEMARFSVAAASDALKNSPWALSRADAFRRSDGRAPGGSCDYFDELCVSNPAQQWHPIEVVDDNLTQCPVDRYYELPEDRVCRFIERESYEQIRHPSEVIDVDVGDDADDGATQLLSEGSIHPTYCETLADGDVVVSRCDEHGRESDSDGEEHSVQAADESPATGECLTRSLLPSTL